MAQERKVDGRQRLVLGAIALLRERGLSGASFGEVTKRTSAPRGSIYHHFPGGKQQLMIEAVDLVGTAVDALIEAVGEDPQHALAAFLDGWRSQLVASDFRAGCPVVGVAVEVGDGEDELTAATARAFDRWCGRFAGLLRRRGVADGDAARVATLVVAAIEGAVILSRAHRSTAPLDDVGSELDALVAGYLARAAASPPDEPNR